MAANGPSTVAAILVAGGAGRRLGAPVPKAFVDLGGQTLLEHAAARFLDLPSVSQVIVVAPPDRVDEARALVGCEVVAGGSTRQRSVRAGLAALAPDVDVVLVHDVARPFVPGDVIAAVVQSVRDGADAVVPVIPIHDTVRSVADAEAAGVLGAVIDRSTLVAVQTPQGFPRTILEAAHAAATDSDSTDDATLVEALGRSVVSVPGSPDSFKITDGNDFARATAFLWLRSAPGSVPGGIS